MWSAGVDARVAAWSQAFRQSAVRALFHPACPAVWAFRAEWRAPRTPVLPQLQLRHGITQEVLKCRPTLRIKLPQNVDGAR